MKTIKNINIIILLLGMFTFSGCSEDFLEVYPQDRITTVSFWQNENDVKLALNGIYSVLKHRGVYGAGPTMDAITPYAFQWAHWNGMQMQIGNGSITAATSGGMLNERWTMCYRIINFSNDFLANIDRVELDEASKSTYLGEVYFLRGLAFALLAETYGGVPVITSVLSTAEVTLVSRNTLEETWNQAISDYDEAIQRLAPVSYEVGRATKGAALGMKMRAYLYQNKYDQVLNLIDEIDALGMYSLFPSYEGLFQLDNENNEEVLFDIQYMVGEQGQGNFFAWLALPGSVAGAGASDPAPTQHIVDKYEMIDGSEVDPNNPFEGRDPRLDFTILRPGATFEGLVYPTEVSNHTGQRVGYNLRKNVGEGIPLLSPRVSPLNFIVLRYADVLLAKAEALIETNQNLEEAIGLINRIRTERTDVTITSLPSDLSQEEARDALRHERVVEFFGEGILWADIKRWNIGQDLYPVEVRTADGGLVEVKFPTGYEDKDNLLPIPDNEISFNENLEQNPGW
ncbi:RagB/SusD family nutrient uptake outer membrane protein [Lunatibacter salilacus]|uniref:RagB/SusD family nutrient uptake outer membrane protein n=1 Tax=Lunatibacter salilacus TaxID=2483804 RepID=UPI00131B5F62|nr:RagB/SusD family nutrient uptake outer membrane protein [Lunatibacter salilacus]